jgi:phosphate transport system permease protein
LAKPLADRDLADLQKLVVDEILQPEVVNAWPLLTSVFNTNAIKLEIENDFPDARLVFRSWVHLDFLGGSQSADPMKAGIRGAIIGTLLTIFVTMLIAFPLGVGAAIWLEEYAPDNKLSRFVQTNIYNLAGVPSIIYGMLGLTIFVRTLGEITQGRTILSAALTLAILVLPIIIINAQEAIKAVPQSLRQASYAVGSTRWQTIWHHVLPACMDRILTGSVLAMSRAIGETAPLVVVGASAFLTHDPSSLFDRFTTLPIQIYQWSSLPNEAYRNLAGGAILVLMVLLMTLNSFAIILRNRYRKENKQ